MLLFLAIVATLIYMMGNTVLDFIITDPNK